MKSIIFSFIFLLSLNISAQTKTNKITKIILGSGYCTCCMGECPIEIVEIDSTLSYSFYTEMYGENISLSKGNTSQEMWDTFSFELEKYNSKRLGYKKPFHLVKGHPIAIQVFRGTKSKIFYADIEILDEVVWKFYERIMNSRKQVELKEEEEFEAYVADNKILTFLKSNQVHDEINQKQNLNSVESILNNSEKINNQTLDIKFRLRILPDNVWILELKSDSTYEYSHISGWGNGSVEKGTYEIKNNLLLFKSTNDDSDLSSKSFFIIVYKAVEDESFIDCVNKDSKTYCLLSIDK